MYAFRLVASATLFALAFAGAAPLVRAVQQSTSQIPTGIIEGRVTAAGGRGVSNIRVSLLTDTYSPISSLYTDSSGRYRFSVVGGVYYIEADPLDQPYERHQERVDVNPSPFSHGNDRFHVDIVLKPLKSGDSVRPSGAGAVRFFQKVPDDARAEYERGMKMLAKDPDGAYEAMKKALELFPDYYQCMESLGSEYVKADQLDAALPILTHAVEVNPSGEMSLYALGVLRYKRNQFADATTSFSKVVELNAKSKNAVLYLGLAQMRAGNAVDAETNLKRAYELGATGVPELHLALAQIYINSKRNKEAATSLRTLLKEVPNLRDKDKIKGLIDKLEKS